MITTPPDLPFEQMTEAKDYPEAGHSSHDQRETNQEGNFIIIHGVVDFRFSITS
jgi:hypothetical protein